MNTLQEYEKKIIKKFMNSDCPCEWIILTREHSKKNCPYYTYSAEKDALLFVLQSQRKLIRKMIEKANIADDKVGSFKEGYDCMKAQVLALLSESNNK